MQYRQLGKTGLSVSRIGLGGEWLERHNEQEVREIISASEAQGINILDCFMSNPQVRTHIGKAIAHNRDHWIIQGHIGSVWQDGQYLRSRDLSLVRPAFEDLLSRLGTDHIELGMIHFVDEAADFDALMRGEFMQYMRSLKQQGRIGHIGLSTHNPEVGIAAVESGEFEAILFSLNPAYDMLPASEDVETLFVEKYDESLNGIDEKRARFYKLCQTHGVGITVMKAYGGGRLLDAQRSCFGVALTPVQCIHYTLTCPAVAAVMVGVDNPQQMLSAVAYEQASEAEKDYATVLANAPHHAYAQGSCTYCGHCAPCPMHIDVAMVNKLYDLATAGETVPDTVRAHYQQLPANASACIGCGLCETRCPFSVQVTAQMQKAAALFAQ